MNLNIEKLAKAVARINGDKDSEVSLTSALVYCDEVANNAELPLDPHLRHYLQRRSYGKAGAFLQAINLAQTSGNPSEN